MSSSAASTDSAAAAVLPQLALTAYLLVVIGAGVLANLAVLGALLKRERNVFHSIVMQLAISDLFLLSGAAGFETWTRNEGTWSFGCALCVLYLGCEVFASTATVYFVVTLSLHALATANLEASNAKLRRARVRDDDSDGEMRSSRHSLVANSDSSTPPRTMNIDYRIANTSVPAAVPIIFVWSLAASLSVPEFTLATAVETKGITLCTFLDPHHRINVSTVRSIFDLFLPAFVLSSAGLLALIKIRQRKRKRTEEGGGVDAVLTLSMWLAGVYALLNAPRSALAAFHAFASPDKEDFLNPLLSVEPQALGLVFSLLNYAAALARPLLCAVTLPELRRSFKFTNRNRSRVI